jgi:hypothetical protein
VHAHILAPFPANTVQIKGVGIGADYPLSAVSDAHHLKLV